MRAAREEGFSQESTTFKHNAPIGRTKLAKTGSRQPRSGHNHLARPTLDVSFNVETGAVRDSQTVHVGRFAAPLQQSDLAFADHAREQNTAIGEVAQCLERLSAFRRRSNQLARPRKLDLSCSVAVSPVISRALPSMSDVTVRSVSTLKPHGAAFRRWELSSPSAERKSLGPPNDVTDRPSSNRVSRLSWFQR